MKKAESSRPERGNRPDVARIRKAYDIVLCTVVAVLFVLVPIYLFFAVYPQRLF